MTDRTPDKVTIELPIEQARLLRDFLLAEEEYVGAGGWVPPGIVVDVTERLDTLSTLNRAIGYQIP